MKRSEINAIMGCDSLMRGHGFRLPPFAYWTPDDWASKGENARIVDVNVGTSPTLARAFTSALACSSSRYATATRPGWPVAAASSTLRRFSSPTWDQVTPFHFHWRKVEDIINRRRQAGDPAYNSTSEDGAGRQRYHCQHRRCPAADAGRQQRSCWSRAKVLPCRRVSTIPSGLKKAGY